MDFTNFNWAYFGLAVSGVLLIVWLVLVIRCRPGIVAGIVSLAHLVVAGMGSAAPLRGYVDPDYVGYGFGLLRADAGIETTLIAGAVFLASAASAFIAARNRGNSIWFVVMTSAFMALNVGGAWLETTLTDLTQNVIQFGEYLTIPGEAGTVLLFVVLVVPFLLGIRLSPRRAQ